MHVLTSILAEADGHFVDAAMLQRRGGEILIWFEFIEAQGQTLGAVECNAPQDTRNVRVV